MEAAVPHPAAVGMTRPSTPAQPVMQWVVALAATKRDDCSRNVWLPRRNSPRNMSGLVGIASLQRILDPVHGSLSETESHGSAGCSGSTIGRLRNKDHWLVYAARGGRPSN